MRKNDSFHVRPVLTILFTWLLALPLMTDAATITQFSYDLGITSEAELLNDWTKSGTGSYAVLGHSALLTTTGDTLAYTRNDIPIDGSQAWMFEAVLSAPGVGGAGERGARFWTRFTDANAPAFPPGDKFRQLEIRLAETGGGERRFALVDGQDGVERASIVANWADAGNRYRVRLR